MLHKGIINQTRNEKDISNVVLAQKIYWRYDTEYPWSARIRTNLNFFSTLKIWIDFAQEPHLKYFFPSLTKIRILPQSSEMRILWVQVTYANPSTLLSKYEFRLVKIILEVVWNVLLPFHNLDLNLVRVWLEK